MNRMEGRGEEEEEEGGDRETFGGRLRRALESGCARTSKCNTCDACKAERRRNARLLYVKRRLVAHSTAYSAI